MGRRTAVHIRDSQNNVNTDCKQDRDLPSCALLPPEVGAPARCTQQVAGGHGLVSTLRGARITMNRASGPVRGQSWTVRSAGRATAATESNEPTGGRSAQIPLIERNITVHTHHSQEHARNPGPWTLHCHIKARPAVPGSYGIALAASRACNCCKACTVKRCSCTTPS